MQRSAELKNSQHLQRASRYHHVWHSPVCQRKETGRQTCTGLAGALPSSGWPPQPAGHPHASPGMWPRSAARPGAVSASQPAAPAAAIAPALPLQPGCPCPPLFLAALPCICTQPAKPPPTQQNGLRVIIFSLAMQPGSPGPPMFLAAPPCTSHQDCSAPIGSSVSLCLLLPNWCFMSEILRQQLTVSQECLTTKHKE